MHFFNPVPMMSLVEVIRGHLTEDSTVDAVRGFREGARQDADRRERTARFVVNRILCPMLNEAILALQEGLASAEDIDSGMKLGCSHPIGPPRRSATWSGLDVLLAVMEVFYRDFNDPSTGPRCC
jgi:3-hydroxybutyryl-CoA dehydrogenase